MPFYNVKFLNEQGKEDYQVMEASDESTLRALLKQNKCVLLKASKIVEKKPNLFFSVSSKIKPTEVVLFLRQFSVMISASISITDSLSALKQQSFSKPFINVLMEVYNDVVSGSLLSEAFGKHPTIFPSFFCDMVAIGEVSGSLESVLKSMADYYENDQKVKKKTKSALVYPKILLGMIVAVVAFLSLFILPKFADMFKEFGSDVPRITKTIIGISEFIKDKFVLLVLIAIAIILSIKLFFTFSLGEKTKDWLALYFPLIGGVNRATIVSRFTKAFIILLQSGMTITDCMDNLLRILDNSLFKEKFKYSISEVKRGKGIAKSIEEINMFPQMLTEMIAVGEKSGNLEEVLSSTNSFYANQVETAIAKATSAIEPIIILILGGVVALVLLSIYLPMIELMNVI